ncbi:hypothetical protein ACFL5E_01915 [Candidatus Omnitrophota bacterium]
MIEKIKTKVPVVKKAIKKKIAEEREVIDRFYKQYRGRDIDAEETS